MAVIPAVRNVTRADGLDDWPTTPDGRYGQLADDNEWAGDNEFTGLLTGPQIEIAVQDATNGSKFDSGVFDPEGWDEVRAATANVLTSPAGFWRLFGNSFNTDYFYTFQTNKDPVSVASNAWQSFSFNDVFHNFGGWTADLAWTLGVYADDSGSADEDIFNRVSIYWDSTAEIFKMRQEVKDGTTQTNGDWYETRADLAIHNQYTIRVALRNDGATGRIRAYVGRGSLVLAQQRLGEIISGIWASSWGDPHIGIGRTRGAGVQDYVWIGGTDTSEDS